MKSMTKRIASILLAMLSSVSLLTALSPAPSAAELKIAIGTVTASALRLRSGPSTAASILTTASCGEAVLVLDREGDWYKVICDRQTGYMHGDYLELDEVKNIALGKARFDHYTNIRQGPGTEYEILSCASTGSSCHIVGFNRGWYKISYNGISGYVRSDLVSLQESSNPTGNSQGSSFGTVETGSGSFIYYTNVRQGPGTNYGILVCAPSQDRCAILGLEAGWYQVRYRGMAGYVRSDLLIVEKNTDTEEEGEGDSDEAVLANASMTKAQKLALVFGTSDISDPRRVYGSASEAEAHMVEITVTAWDIGSNGEKYARSWPLTVHENIAPTVKAIFAEIYALPEQPPIHSLGGYRWANASEHSVGLAMDLNAAENYYCDPSGNALVGSYFCPDSDPYSIPVGGSVDQIFAKYGFTRGIYWQSGYKDYMHYSFFGT